MKPVEPKGHLFGLKLAIVGQNLPERSGISASDSLEGKTHDSRDGAVDQAR